MSVDVDISVNLKHDGSLGNYIQDGELKSGTEIKRNFNI